MIARLASCAVMMTALLAPSALPLSAQPTNVRVMAEPPMPGEPVRSEEDIEREMVELFQKEGMFGVVTRDLSPDQRLVVCEMVATNYAGIAAGASDPQTRTLRLTDVWQLEQRLAGPLPAAKARLGDVGYRSAQRNAGQALTLLSMAPDESLKQQIKSADDLIFAFIGSLASRCNMMLDTMGIARVSGEPPQDYLERQSRFRFRGDDYETVFAGTGLAPFAALMCRGDAAPDFIGAPMEERGTNGMSLLDWSMECEDRASFTALVAAGHDLDAIGLFEEPPLVRAANEKRLAYLTDLLDAGVNPDAMGRSNTALREATRDLDASNYGGDDEVAYRLLRARGASLNFPDFTDSMWFEWSLHRTRWDLILAHWDEFDSDPVELASHLESYLAGEWAWAKEEYEPQAQQVKALLIRDYGVCFPVGNPRNMSEDARGFAVQPDCPRR